MKLLRTLRFRLTLWNAVAALATAAAALVGMQIGVRQALQHELDQFLVDDLQTLSDALTAAPASPQTSPLAELKAWYRHPRHGRFVAIFDERGEKLWETTDHPPPDLAIPPPRDDSPFFAGDYRMIQRRVTSPSGTTWIVRTGIPLAPLRDEIANIDLLSLIVTAFVIPIALAIGWFLAGRVTKVLGTLTEQAAGLRPVKMGERLPVRGTGDEFDSMAIEFNRLFDRVTAELARREDVLAHAAHELRTPLAAIRSAAEVSLASPRRLEEYEATLGDVLEECDTLQELVAALLALYESEADRLRAFGDQVALDVLVDKTADAFRPAAESSGVKLVATTSPALIEGSEIRLRQALNNLFDNALKHVSAGGRIEVSMRSVLDDGWIEIAVKDDGIGIPIEEQPKIFDRFYRGESDRRGDRASKGFGLGLALVKAIVESHGGTIRVESEPGQGAAFVLLLPLVRGDSDIDSNGIEDTP
jgi:signal transduction histidine kinase